MTFPLERYTSVEFPPDVPILLYAGSCPKCRFLSRCVVLWSLGRVKRVALEVAQWKQLYYEHLPEAKGFPVLLLEDGPVYGPRVFAIVPLVVLKSWVIQPLKPFTSLLRRNPVERHGQ